MLWWETRCYLLFKAVSHSQDLLLISWLDSSLIPLFCPGRPRPILLPDFRGLHHLQRRVSAVVCSGDQRKNNGGDNARLQPSELQEHRHWKFRHSFNWTLRHYRLFNVVGFTALNSLDKRLSNVPNSQCTLFIVIFLINLFQASSVHFCLLTLIIKGNILCINIFNSFVAHPCTSKRDKTQ